MIYSTIKLCDINSTEDENREAILQKVTPIIWMSVMKDLTDMTISEESKPKEINFLDMHCSKELLKTLKALLYCTCQSKQATSQSISEIKHVKYC